MPDEESQAVRRWFADYLVWMTTEQNGIDERDAKNNHGTCWVMQVAAFARSPATRSELGMCREALQGGARAEPDGRRRQLPAGARRTKPYGYSLFNLDAMATICQILSTPADNLWTFELPTAAACGGVAYMDPYIEDKTRGRIRATCSTTTMAGAPTEPAICWLALEPPDYVELWQD